MFTESVRIGCSFLACCGGSAKYQHVWYFTDPYDSVSGLWLCPPGNRSVVDLYSLLVTLPVLSYTVTVLSGSTCHPVVVKYQEFTSRQAVHTNRPYLKANRPVANITDLTWTLPVKTGSLLVFKNIVDNISEGQARNTNRQAINRNRQGHYSNRQVRTCIGQACLYSTEFPTHHPRLSSTHVCLFLYCNWRSSYQNNLDSPTKSWSLDLWPTFLLLEYLDILITPITSIINCSGVVSHWPLPWYN